MKKVLLGSLIGIAAFTLVGGAVALANSGNDFGLFGGHKQMFENKADILGITAEELETQLEGNSFAELLDKQGVTHEEFREQMHTGMQASMTEKLQQMVDDGILTEEQMQEKLEFMEQRHAEGGGPHMMGKGIGGRGMYRGFVDANGDGVCDHFDKE
ncbi:MAG TPA: hypothetical protein ENL10_02990 [Candidatus Cloacimonetes bacterium]|nr:hypothetical protein [Candidatus Cloacimonadota bacterium]